MDSIAPRSKVECNFPFLNGKNDKNVRGGHWTIGTSFFLFLFSHFLCIAKWWNPSKNENENIFYEKKCLPNMPLESSNSCNNHPEGNLWFGRLHVLFGTGQNKALSSKIDALTLLRASLFGSINTLSFLNYTHFKSLTWWKMKNLFT